MFMIINLEVDSDFITLNINSYQQLITKMYFERNVHFE